MNRSLVDIALPLPLDRTFTYLVPPELELHAVPGKRALVPFGTKHLTGIIIAQPDSTNVKGLKPITDVLDIRPTFSDEMLHLTRWIADYYLTPWGEVLRAAMPQGLALESKKTVRLIARDIDALLLSTKKTAPRQRSILTALKNAHSVSLGQLQKKTRIKSIHALLNEMEQRGWVAINEMIAEAKAKPKMEKRVGLTERGKDLLGDGEKKPALKQLAVLRALSAEMQAGVETVEIHAFLQRNRLSLSSFKTLVKNGYLRAFEREVLRKSDYEADGPPPDIALNIYQQSALQEITGTVEAGEFRAFLLHGITASGKTQVYIEAIRKVLAIGKTAIVLVPEISLTPQTVRRFKAHFGDDVAVMHSQMSVGERYDAWRTARDGKIKIVIGPRSAIFAPLEHIGLIVVDEEHEGSYKQFDAAPRYNARDVAIVRASRTKATVILGTATPSAESYYNAINGKYTLLELPQRIDTARLPTIEIVDMAKEKQRTYEELKEEVKKSGKEFPKRLPQSSVSRLLRFHIAARLERREGTILLQNRRGFSHIFECFDCGYVEKCENCDVSLTFHETKKHLRCHYCGFVKKPPTVCPKCGSIELRMHSFGTQQVQQELQELFPNATILRMDRDTTSRKGAHDRILKQFESGEADILLGTQMVAKGLDFPRVTLVGVISADTQMLLPDFRASEETFQLLTQVAGRAGRSNLAGEVVIQTLQPDHYCLKHVLSHDFRGFYQEELEYRRELDYPPFSRIVLLEFTGERENEVEHHAKKFVEMIEMHNREKKFILLGPADAAIPRIKGLYRKHVVIKDLKNADPFAASLRNALLKAKIRYKTSALAKNKKVKMIIDVDPQGMM